MIDLKSFAAHHRLRLVAREISYGNVTASRKSLFPGASHWQCTLVTGRGKWRRRMRMKFSQGSAYTEPPKLEDVLQAAKDDALSYVNNPEYQDFKNKYGTDVLSYIGCGKTYKNLARLLAGEYVRDYLMYEIDSI